MHHCYLLMIIIIIIKQGFLEGANAPISFIYNDNNNNTIFLKGANAPLSFISNNNNNI